MNKPCYCVKCNIEQNREVTLESMALWACYRVEKNLEKYSIEHVNHKQTIESTREKFIDMQRTYVKEVRSEK